jgi:hypothetical protein
MLLRIYAVLLKEPCSSVFGRKKKPGIDESEDDFGRTRNRRFTVLFLGGGI